MNTITDLVTLNCRRLAVAQGYRLLDARRPYPDGPLFCRRTGYLTVRADVVDDDGTEPLFSGDETAYERLISQALQQDLCFPQVRLSVVVTETGEELTSRYCDLFFRSAVPLRRAFSGLRHELKALFADARQSVAARRQIYHDIRLAE